MKKSSLLFCAMFCVFLSACERNVSDEIVDLTFNGKEMSVSYTGKLDGGVPADSGSFKVSDGDNEWSFSGTFTEGMATGSGELQNYPLTISFSGSEYPGLYSGSTLNGIPNGDGHFVYENGDVSVKYDGSFIDGVPSDNGHLSSNDFTVSFSDVSRVGTYDGDTVNGVACGIGTYSATNSGGVKYTYTGHWNDNIFNGDGTLKYDDDSIVQYGNFENGSWLPTKSDFIKSIGTDASSPYSISEDNYNFISSNSNLFPSDSLAAISEYIDPNITFDIYSKNPSATSKKLITLQNQYVVQISESTYSGKDFDTITQMLLVDTETFSKYTSCYYFGSVDIFVDDIIDLIALPVDYSTFDNIGGGKTWNITCVGNYIEKK